MDYGEVQDRIDAIRNLHLDSDRERIRRVMNGGAAGIQAVLNWEDGGNRNGVGSSDGLGVDLPTANVMWSGL